MSTPYGGADQNQGWSSPGGAPVDPSGSDPGYSPPGGPPPDGFGQPDYSQVQPDYGRPYGQRPLDLAGFWIRFGGAVIDAIIIGIAQFILAMIIDMNTAQGLGFLISAVYFTYFHGSTGQTLGNKALNIRVIDADAGDAIGYGRAFLRWVVSFFSGMVIGLGYLWMLWDSNNQTWHDKAAKSVVVKVS